MSPPSHGRRASLDTLASFGSLLWAVSASQKQHSVVFAHLLLTMGAYVHLTTLILLDFDNLNINIFYHK